MFGALLGFAVGLPGGASLVDYFGKPMNAYEETIPELNNKYKGAEYLIVKTRTGKKYPMVRYNLDGPYMNLEESRNDFNVEQRFENQELVKKLIED